MLPTLCLQTREACYVMWHLQSYGALGVKHCNIWRFYLRNFAICLYFVCIPVIAPKGWSQKWPEHVINNIYFTDMPLLVRVDKCKYSFNAVILNVLQSMSYYFTWNAVCLRIQSGLLLKITSHNYVHKSFKFMYVQYGWSYGVFILKCWHPLT